MEKVFENEKVIKFEVVVGKNQKEILIVATDKEVEVVELNSDKKLEKVTIDTNPITYNQQGKENRLFKQNKEIQSLRLSEVLEILAIGFVQGHISIYQKEDNLYVFKFRIKV